MESNKNYRLDLLNRFFEGKTSEEEEKCVQDFYLDSELEFEIKEKMRAHLKKLSESTSVNMGDKNAKTRVFENIKHRINNSRQVSIRHAIHRIFKIAAFIIFVLAIGGILSYNVLNISGKKDRYFIARSPMGSKSEMVLPDGTKIWLNAGSELRYPANFMDGSREVYLEGEAYFDVAKMKDKIFIVKTADVKIIVYGTQFNVKSYPEEDHIQTTLVEGSLTVELIHGKKNTMVVKPNQSVTIYKSQLDKSINKGKDVREVSEKVDKNPRIEVTPIKDPLPIISWKDAKWVFVGEELEQLALKLERRYNVKIIVLDESLKHYRFSGTLKSQTFEQVLKIIQESAPVLFKVENDLVIFEEDPLYKEKYDRMIKNPN